MKTLLLLLVAQDPGAEKIARKFISQLGDKPYRAFAFDGLGNMSDRLEGAVLADAIQAVEEALKQVDPKTESSIARYGEDALAALKRQKASPFRIKEERDVTAEEVDRAIAKAVKRLAAFQNRDGSWGDAITAPAETGIAVGALLASPLRDTEEARAAAERGARWLVNAVMSEDFAASKAGVAKHLEGGTATSALFGWSPHFMSCCSHTILALLAAKPLKLDEKAVKGAIERCVAALRETQAKHGGWMKYSKDQPRANFMIAEGMQALAAAKAAGFDPGEGTLPAAVAWMEGNAKQDYPYLGDPISRRVSGELALAMCGTERPGRLEAAVEKFFAERPLLERIRLRKSGHQSDWGALSTTAYMYGYWHVARTVDRLGADAKAKWGPKLVKTFVNTQEEDGGWRCGPQPERPTAYNTAIGLAVLALARK